MIISTSLLKRQNRRATFLEAIYAIRYSQVCKLAAVKCYHYVRKSRKVRLDHANGIEASACRSKEEPLQNLTDTKMDTDARARNSDNDTVRPIISSKCTDGKMDTREDSPHSNSEQRRTSTIRFSQDTMDTASSSVSRRRTVDSDEITPIRQADSNADRNYNTTETTTSRLQAASKSNEPADTDQEKPSWLKRVAEKYGSITLENKGSVARDHLALERTFLAWLRTSLAFASIGIAITQLFRLNTSIQKRPESASIPARQTLPLSPFLGHGLAPELIPLLQQLVAATSPSLPLPKSAGTLLEQLLTPSTGQLGSGLSTAEFDDNAATKLRRAGKPLGATFIGVSIVVLFVGFHRYFESQYWIIRGKFPASRGSVALVGAIAGALIIGSLIVVLIIAPFSYQKP